MKKTNLLPPLSKEQVDNLIAVLRANFNQIDDEEDYCCTSDAVDGVFGNTLRLIEKVYGFYKEEENDE